MATKQLLAPMPAVMLPPGSQIRFEAIDESTGLAVAGVTVSAIAVSGPSGAGGFAGFRAGPFMLVPGPGEE